MTNPKNHEFATAFVFSESLVELIYNKVGIRSRSLSVTAVELMLGNADVFNDLNLHVELDNEFTVVIKDRNGPRPTGDKESRVGLFLQDLAQSCSGKEFVLAAGP